MSESVIQNAQYQQKPGTLKINQSGVSWTSKNSHVSIEADEISSLQWSSGSTGFEFKVVKRGDKAFRFQGLSEKDFGQLKDIAETQLKRPLQKVQVCTRGWNWGDFDFTEEALEFKVEGQQDFQLPFNRIAQSVIQGKHELALEFHEEDNATTEDCLAEMRIYVPPDEEEAALDDFNKKIVEAAELGLDAGESIASFKALSFAVPRGRYEIDIYASFFRLHGRTFSYKILYTSISNLFLLSDHPDADKLLIISIDPPIRQGRTSYPHLLLQFQAQETISIKLNMEEKKLKEKFGGRLTPVMQGLTHAVVSQIFKEISEKKKIIGPGSFKSKSDSPCVRCSLKANEGNLYFLDTSFFFVKKPPTYIRHSDVLSIEFVRLDNSAGGGRLFDLILNVKGEPSVYVFTNIQRIDLEPIFDFLSKKKLTIVDADDVSKFIMSGPVVQSRNKEDVDPYLNKITEELEEGQDSEEDEDFKSGGSEGSDDESESGSGGDESDESGSGSDDDEPDSGDEEIMGKESKKRKKPAKSSSPGKDKPKESKEKASSSKKKSKTDGDGDKGKKKKKKSGVKKSASAYMFFMKAIRPQIQKENPGASFTELGKLVGDKWRQLSDEAKKPYEAEAKADQERYRKEKANAKDDSEDEDKPKKKKKESQVKSASSAYIFFCKEWRPKLASQNPSAKQQELMKLLGEKWNSLSEAEKKPFEEMSNKDKQRYQEEKASEKSEQKEKAKAAEKGKDSSSSSSSKKDGSKKDDSSKSKDGAKAKDSSSSKSSDAKSKDAAKSKDSEKKQDGSKKDDSSKSKATDKDKTDKDKDAQKKATSSSSSSSSSSSKTKSPQTSKKSS